MQIMDIDSMLRKVHNEDKHNKKAYLVNFTYIKGFKNSNLMINECRHSWESILSDISIPDDPLLLASVVYDLTSQAYHKVLQYLGGNALGYNHEPTENRLKI